MTKEEFIDNLECIVHVLEQSEQLDGAPLLVSWDNAHNNATAADLQDGGFHELKRIPLPPYSPDMHKVVESFLGRLDADFHKRLLHHPSYRSPEQLQSLLLHAFTCMPREHIEASVKGLRLTYRMIFEPAGQEFTEGGKAYTGCGANWPPHKFR